MPDYILYLIFAVSLFVIEVLYFQIADRFNIIDHPNDRSSHTIVTLRGGGIIFPIAIFGYFLFSGFNYPYLVSGLFFISLISFIDDIDSIPNKIRLVVHVLSVSIVFYYFGIFTKDIWLIVCFYIFTIGAINAYNFMDGINGITGCYTLSIISTFLYLNSILSFVDNKLLVVLILAILVFLFFNFRTKAKCFGGDVGSVSLAFAVFFLLAALIVKTNQFMYILFLALYGVDSFLTISLRFTRKENIFEPHRKHVFQLLSNELGYSQLFVSLGYGILQLLLNTIIIYVVGSNFPIWTQISISSILIILLATLYFRILKAVDLKRDL